MSKSPSLELLETISDCSYFVILKQDIKSLIFFNIENKKLMESVDFTNKILQYWGKYGLKIDLEKNDCIENIITKIINSLCEI